MEVRQLADVSDLIAVELECSRGGCPGRATLTVERAVFTLEHMQCPLCSRDWWTPERASVQRSFVDGIIGLLHNIHRAEARPNVPTPPRVRLVLPGRLA